MASGVVVGRGQNAGSPNAFSLVRRDGKRAPSPLDVLRKVDGVTIRHTELLEGDTKTYGGYELGAKMAMQRLGIDGHHEAFALRIDSRRNYRDYVFDFLWHVFIGSHKRPLVEEEHGLFERLKQKRMNSAAQTYRRYMHSHLVHSFDMTMFLHMVRIEDDSKRLAARGLSEPQVFEELYRRESAAGTIDKKLRRFFDQAYVLRESHVDGESQEEARLKDFIMLVDYVRSYRWSGGLMARMKFEVNEYTRMRNIWLRQLDEPHGAFSVSVGKNVYISSEGLELWISEYIMAQLDLIQAKACEVGVNGERVPKSAYLADLPRVNVMFEGNMIPISDYISIPRAVRQSSMTSLLRIGA